MKRPLLHWLLLGTLVAMWGSSFLFTKIAVTSLEPSAIVLARLALGAGVLLLFLVVLRQGLPRGLRVWAFLLGMAVMGNALPFWLITWGQQAIDSGLAGILMAIMPLSTLLLAHYLVAGERLTPLRAVGFLLGFGGIVVLIGPSALLEFEGEGTALFSELAVLGGALCYAINTIIARHRPPGPLLGSTAGVMLLASALVLPLGLPEIEHIDWPALPAEALAAVVVLGLVSTALATVVYLKLISLAGPTFVSLINYLIPLWAVLVGMVVLGERPGWSALAALALILSGIALSEKGRAKGRE